MRVTMSEDHKQPTDTMTTYFVNSPEAPVEVKTSRTTKKHVIAAVTVVLVVSLVVTGVLFTQYMFTQHSTALLKYKLDLLSPDNTRASEEVSTDLQENIVQYHVVDKSHEWWVIDDFGKDMQVTKDVTSDGAVCYVSPLNRTSRVLPSEVVTPSQSKVMLARAMSDAKLQEISATPVSDHSFLGTTARSLCRDVPVYWSYPTCTSTLSSDMAAVDTPGTRVKREEMACAPEACCWRVCITGTGTLNYRYFIDVDGELKCHWNYKTSGQVHVTRLPCPEADRKINESNKS